jgi:hypothetical protein
VSQEQVIDREEALALMWLLADIKTDIAFIRNVLEGGEEDEEAE